MKICRVCAAYWSPTGSTRKVVLQVAEALSKELNCPVQEIRFTLPGDREEERAFGETDLVVLGTPTYAGRVPNKLSPFLREKLRGCGALAVAVVTYGNRSYDNALAELCAILTADGFRTVSAGAFVAQHAFAPALGAWRPDACDMAQASALGRQTADKIGNSVRGLQPIQVPGDPEAPYYIPKGQDGEPAKFLKARPRTDPGKCCGCGVCARVCPMGAIDPQNVCSVPGTCIKCQACVTRCTRNAKFFDDAAFLSHKAMLEATFSEPQKNEVFL